MVSRKKNHSKRLFKTTLSAISRVLRSNFEGFDKQAYSENEMLPDQLKEKVKETNEYSLLKQYLDSSREPNKQNIAVQVIDALFKEDPSRF